jgi:hypothetical protein
MNLYHCMIELKSDAKALAFSAALDAWMTHIQERGMIRDWRLMRRKLNLAADSCADFLLEIEVEDLTQLDKAFRLLGASDDETARKYTQVHQLIAQAQFGLYRPFPDPERVERLALL